MFIIPSSVSFTGNSIGKKNNKVLFIQSLYSSTFRLLFILQTCIVQRNTFMQSVIIVYNESIEQHWQNTTKAQALYRQVYCTQNKVNQYY